MSKSWQSIGWEYGVRILGPALVSLLGFLLLPYFFMRVGLGLPYSAFEATFYYLPQFAFTLLIFGTWLAYHFEQMPRRIFCLPLSNGSVTLWLLVVPTVMVMVCQLSSVPLLRGIYGAYWPILRPTLLMAVLVVLGLNLSFFWQQRRFLECAGMFLGCLALLYVGYLVSYPGGYNEKIDPRAPFQVWELLCYGVFYFSGVWIGKRSLALLRCGEIAAPKSVDAGSEREHALDFVDPIGALEHHFWKQGAKVPLIATPILCVLSCAMQFLVNAGQSESIMEISLVMTALVAWVSSFFLGLNLGRCVRVPGKPNCQRMSSFLATKPINDGEFLQAAVRILVKSCLIGCAITWSFSLILPQLIWKAMHPEASLADTSHGTLSRIFMEGGLHPVVLNVLFMATLLLFFAAVSSLTAAGAFSCQDTLFAMIAAVGMFVFVLFCAFSGMLSPPWDKIGPAITTMIVALCVAGSTFGLFVYGRRIGVISDSFVWYALGIWGLLCSGYYVYQHVILPTGTLLGLIQVALFLSLAVAGMAALPLGLRFGRHA